MESGRRAARKVGLHHAPDDLMKGFRCIGIAFIYLSSEWVDGSFVLVEVDGIERLGK